MDTAQPDVYTPPGQELGWPNVALAFTFILFDALISRIFGLELGNSLVVAAVRCIVQLSLVAVILQRVFETDSAWAVAGIACEYRSSGSCCCIQVDSQFEQSRLI